MLSILSMNPYKIIGIIGTRRRDNHHDYLEVLRKFEHLYNPGDRIVSGGCPQGGDRFAEKIAKDMQVPITIHYAAWNRLGKKAGYTRNVDIANDADILIAVVASDRTGGTEHTIEEFMKLKNGRLILI